MTNRNAPINQILTTSDHTVNYDLPLWQGQDMTSWLTQVNDAMDKIDSAIYERQTDIAKIDDKVDEAVNTANTAANDVDEATKEVQGLLDDMAAAQKKIVEHTNQIKELETLTTSMDTEIHSLQDLTDSMMDDISMTNNKVAAIDGTVGILDEKVAKIAGSMAILDAKVEGISGTVAQLVEKTENIPPNVGTDLTNIETRLDGHDTDIANLKTADSQTAAAVVSLNTQLQNIDERVTQNADNISELATKIGSAPTVRNIWSGATGDGGGVVVYPYSDSNNIHYAIGMFRLTVTLTAELAPSGQITKNINFQFKDTTAQLNSALNEALEGSGRSVSALLQQQVVTLTNFGTTAIPSGTTLSFIFNGVFFDK